MEQYDEAVEFDEPVVMAEADENLPGELATDAQNDVEEEDKEVDAVAEEIPSLADEQIPRGEIEVFDRILL